jgi:hypothetical protein
MLLRLRQAGTFSLTGNRGINTQPPEHPTVHGSAVSAKLQIGPLPMTPVPYNLVQDGAFQQTPNGPMWTEQPVKTGQTGADLTDLR